MGRRFFMIATLLATGILLGQNEQSNTISAYLTKIDIQQAKIDSLQNYIANKIDSVMAFAVRSDSMLMNQKEIKHVSTTIENLNESVENYNGEVNQNIRNYTENSEKKIQTYNDSVTMQIKNFRTKVDSSMTVFYDDVNTGIENFVNEIENSLNLFALITMFLSCLGLFIIRPRYKEWIDRIAHNHKWLKKIASSKSINSFFGASKIICDALLGSSVFAILINLSIKPTAILYLLLMPFFISLSYFLELTTARSKSLRTLQSKNQKQSRRRRATISH